MTVALSQSVTFAIGNEDADGAPVNASSIVGTLYRNGAATAEDVDVDNVATGVYSVAFTVPADWSIADVLQVRIVADGIGRFVWGDAIDATVNSRSTYAGADTSGTTTLLTRIVGTLASGTHNPQSGDAFARLGAPAGASVSADIAAISTVTARINTGLVADGGLWQFTANMLELGPSGGGGGGGGPTTEQEETLNTIYSQTSQITGSRINTVGPVSAAGDITLILGKDYKVASESELTISVPDIAGALHADFTSGTLAASKAFGMSRANGDADIVGTVYSVSYATNVTTFKIEIDANQLPDTLSLTDDWTYQIERVTSSGDKVVGVQGAGKVAMRAV